jgi:hypothetical protein
MCGEIVHILVTNKETEMRTGKNKETDMRSQMLFFGTTFPKGCIYILMKKDLKRFHIYNMW